MNALIDLDSAREIFKRWLPLWFSLLDELADQGGQMQLHPELGHYLKANDHDTYPLIYERWPQVTESVQATLERGLDLVLPGTDISLATPESRGNFLIQLLEGLDEIEPLIGPHITAEERAAAETVSSEIDSEDLEILQPALDKFPSLIMAMVHEYLSIPVHGVRLSTLVQWAKAGDDKAFGNAIQIDGRILVAIPYFADRYAQARLEGDARFLRMVAQKTSAPPYKGLIKQKPIWLVIGLLDTFGLLSSMSGEEALDFCNDVGANDGDEPIEDVKNILKRIATYKRYQKKTPMSTP